MNRVEQVADALMAEDCLVVDMIRAPGFPDMMIVVRNTMPVFVWVDPAKRNYEWQGYKNMCVRNMETVNAGAVDIDSDEDLATLIEQIKAVAGDTVATWAKEPAPVDAASQGFEVEPRVDAFLD